jgi:hypothetical protein
MATETAFKQILFEALSNLVPEPKVAPTKEDRACFEAIKPKLMAVASREKLVQFLLKTCFESAIKKPETERLAFLEVFLSKAILKYKSRLGTRKTSVMENAVSALEQGVDPHNLDWLADLMRISNLKLPEIIQFFPGLSPEQKSDLEHMDDLLPIDGCFSGSCTRDHPDYKRRCDDIMNQDLRFNVEFRLRLLLWEKDLDYLVGDEA